MSFYDFLDGIHESNEIQSLVSESVELENELQSQLDAAPHGIDKIIIENKFMEMIFENEMMKNLYKSLIQKYKKTPIRVIMNKDLVGVFTPTLEPLAEISPKGTKLDVLFDGDKKKTFATGELVLAAIDKAVNNI